MSTHNIGFYEDLTKIIFELSSNTHLISSAVLVKIDQSSGDILANLSHCFLQGSVYCFCHAEAKVFKDNNLVNRNDLKFSDRQVWANSADPDQTAPLLLEEQSDQGIHCLLFHLHRFEEKPLRFGLFV